MSNLTRSLVVRADDAGSAIGANRAIRDCVRAGIVTAVGFMAVGPYFSDAVTSLRDELSTVDVGVHATLNAEWTTTRWGPVSRRETVPSLIDASGFLHAHPRDLQNRLVLEEIIAEIRAQIKTVRASGMDPYYLDTHMGIDRLPGVGAALVALAEQEGLQFTARAPDQVPIDSRQGPGEAGAEWIKQILRLQHGRYQLVTHPGSDTPDLQQFVHSGLEPGQIARERASETRALCSPDFRRALVDAGVRLVRFSDPA